MSIVDFDTTTWNDPWFRQLPLKAKVLFVFLWTNDHKNLACLYEIDTAAMGFYTGLSINQAKDTLPILYPKVRYDFDKQVVWVVSFVRRQFMRTPNISPKIITGITNNLIQMNGHFFVGEFLEEYPSLNIIYPYPIDTVSEGYQYPPSGGGGERKGKGEGEGKKVVGSFDRFWQAYPKKKSKGQAETTFAKIKPNEQLLTAMIATIEKAKKSEEWRKENGKFIPHPSTWLNAKGWEDEFTIPREQDTIDRKKPICSKCKEHESVADHDDGKDYCAECWPGAKKNQTQVVGLARGVFKEMPGLMSEADKEAKIAELRRQKEKLTE